MNFFQHQEDARRQSRKLLFYFALAVLLIVVAVNAAVGLVILVVSDQTVSVRSWFEQPWWAVVSGLTLLAVVFGSFRRMLQLGQGGDAIAEWAGATRMDMHSQRQRDRVFINVAEEMSIASGTPLPSLWVMEREGAINAFVAGLMPTEAALVVTRGCLDQLDRDELQGVIGHEFSHIFHGDMRLNARLMGVLAGILAVGQIGGLMLRSTGAGVSHRRGAQTYAVVLAAGFALMSIGYIGLFFGRLIKASVSRQREFLADASAVQYTRNGAGIVGALTKIRDFSFGSTLVGARSEEMSHMCFGETLRVSFGGLLATHPPLDQRIHRIDPHFGVKQRGKARLAEEQLNANAGSTESLAASMGFTAFTQDVISVNALEVVESVGNPAPAHVEYAHVLHEAIPVQLSIALHGKITARRAVMAMLLGEDQKYIDKCLRIITSAEGADVSIHVTQLHALVKTQWSRLRLAVVDLALPQLKLMTFEERKVFLKTVGDLVAADGRLSLFEFTLLTILRRHLPGSTKRNKRATRFSYQAVEREIALLLSLMIRVGDDGEGADQRYAQLLKSFTPTGIDRHSLPGLNGKSLNAALEVLQTLVPVLKASLIQALVECVLHNGHISIVEAELLRAVSETLDCPLPPLIGTLPRH
jgi:Zn-dependent protease with chaperone function